MGVNEGKYLFSGRTREFRHLHLVTSAIFGCLLISWLSFFLLPGSGAVTEVLQEICAEL
jgi:hypothetical protein